MPDAKQAPDCVLAVIDFENGYAGLVDAMRARANEMAIAVGGASAAEISGLPSSYLAKLLSPSRSPARRFGAISLGPVLGVLGLKLVVMSDEKAVQKFGSKIEKRQERCAHHAAAIHYRFTRKHMREIGKKGAQVRWRAERERMRAQQEISAMNRKAALVRWSNVTASACAALVSSATSKASPRAAAPRRGRPRSADNGGATIRARPR